VNADVPDSPGQPAEQADERKGLRALLRQATPDDGATETRGHSREPHGGPAAATSALATSAPEAAAPPKAAAPPDAGTRPARGKQLGRPIINPHWRADPRLRVWVTRGIVALLVFVGFGIGLGWRYGLTAAVIYAAADSIYRSKTTAVVPASARVTSAQRLTRRRLKVLHASGYRALHARTIPGTRNVIDHVVVGPAGVFTLDSQRLDKRLPLRVIDGMLYHGSTSMAGRLDHAKHEAKQAAALVAAELGLRVRVRPVMVMYGPRIAWTIMKVKGVDVLDGGRIGTYFKRRTKATAQNQLSADQIAMIIAASAKALPPLT